MTAKSFIGVSSILKQIGLLFTIFQKGYMLCLFIKKSLAHLDFEEHYDCVNRLSTQKYAQHIETRRSYLALLFTFI